MQFSYALSFRVTMIILFFLRKSNLLTIKDFAEREHYSCKAPKKEMLIKDKEIIVERHKTESLRQIAKDYGVSANYLKDFLKNRL